MENASVTGKKTPLLVVVYAWLMLFGGAGGLFVIFTVTPSMILLIAVIVFIIVSIGILKMQRWALYLISTITLISILSLIYGYFFGAVTYLPILKGTGNSQLISTIFQSIMLVYFWTISKKFN